jgi:hypothetical protein
MLASLKVLDRTAGPRNLIRCRPGANGRNRLCRNFPLHRLSGRHGVTVYKIIAYTEFSQFEHPVTIILPTRYNIIIYNELCYFFRLCRLSYRHAITFWYITRYGVFSGPDGYPTDTRNTNNHFDLWQIQSSDYPADMRKSIPEQEMWQTDLFAPRGRACARLARDVFRAVDDSRI